MEKSQSQQALGQIESARQYMLSLVEDFEPDQWFQMPNGMETHLAWQIGHLAVAEYGLALFRRRGRLPEDREIMPGVFRKQFSRGTLPDPDPSNHPSGEELLAIMARIHNQVKSELASCKDADLTDEVDLPYAGEPTKLGALWFCAHHEMLHAGQIGLLRRALGKNPIR